jgi:hypothetical protein
LSKRTILKTLAFLCGLYFFLEYFLPEKLGGDFDAYEVHSPAPMIQDDNLVLFYVGQYRKEEGAVGRLVAPDVSEGEWRRNPDSPVLQRSLFVPHDKWGMEKLDVVASKESLCILYIGRNPQQTPVLCYAEKRSTESTWTKRGPVLFTLNSRDPQPTITEPNGALPGSIVSFAVEKIQEQWHVLLALRVTGSGFQVWHAEGSSLSSMQLKSEPVVGSHMVPLDMTAFDAQHVNEGWNVDFVVGTSVKSLIWQEGEELTWQATVELAVDDGGEITGLRTTPDGRTLFLAESLKLDHRAVPEDSDHRTRILVQERDAGIPRIIRTVGKRGRITYLSRASQTAGSYLEIIGAFAVFIAMFNLGLFHGKKIIQRREGNYNSVVFFIFLFSMVVFTFMGRAEKAAGTWWRTGYDFLFESFQRPLGTAVFAMITFYMISAAYRSFRVRSLEAALLMISACIAMVGQMPIGQWLGTMVPDSMPMFKLPWLADKLLNVINASAYRGVMIGLGIGGFSIALRIWLGLDDSVYSGLEGKD